MNTYVYFSIHKPLHMQTYVYINLCRCIHLSRHISADVYTCRDMYTSMYTSCIHHLYIAMQTSMYTPWSPRFIHISTSAHIYISSQSFNIQEKSICRIYLHCNLALCAFWPCHDDTNILLALYICVLLYFDALSGCQISSFHFLCPICFKERWITGGLPFTTETDPKPYSTKVYS